MSETKRMPMKELAQTPDYQRLTNKQKLFVMTYVQAGIDCGEYDEIGACLTAYKCKSREIARIMSYALMANIRIIAVLNLHFGATPTEQFLEEIDRAIRNKKLTQAQLGALQLKCRVLGIKTMIPDDHTPIERKIEEVAQHAAKAEKKAKREKPIQPIEPAKVDFSKTPRF
jgi:hypothetical protein